MRELIIHRGLTQITPRARFSKAPEAFPARKVIFSLSICKNREVNMPETSCMNRTSVHIKET